MNCHTIFLLTACLGALHLQGAEPATADNVVARSGPERNSLLGFDYKSDVRSGENAGHELTHPFVAIRFSQSQFSRDGDTGPWTAAIPLSPLPSGRRLAIAAWIAPAEVPAPIQAAGGWFSKNL